ncbi:isoprenylcysteine carboxylmethyltransferase family protein [Myxococcota bacterium]|nr:isoprenylcysteine carboxylmethyltransferase family protein [Myxococcota bacterium]
MAHDIPPQASRIGDLLARGLGFAWFAFLAGGMVQLRIRPLLDAPSWNCRMAGDLIPLVVDVLFYVMVAVIFLVRRVPARKAPGIVPRVAAFLGAFGLLGLGYLPVRSEPWILWTAAILSLLAHGWMFLSLCWLGRNFSIFPQARGLVTSGPYRVVRHPLYLGEIVAAIALALLHLGPVAAGAVMAWIPIQVYRALVEERVLAATHPEYESYRQRVRRLVPGLW